MLMIIHKIDIPAHQNTSVFEAVSVLRAK